MAANEAMNGAVNGEQKKYALPFKVRWIQRPVVLVGAGQPRTIPRLS